MITLEHAVICLPVLLANSLPEVLCLGPFFYFLNFDTAVVVEAKLRGIHVAHTHTHTDTHRHTHTHRHTYTHTHTHAHTHTLMYIHNNIYMHRPTLTCSHKIVYRHTHTHTHTHSHPAHIHT